MPRYKLTIEYDGNRYSGWQKQTDRPSVQEALIHAVQKFSGETVDVVGAGRTDAGVHALAQAAHIELGKEYEPFQIMQGINYYLFTELPHENAAERGSSWPENRIAILNAERMPDDFHARFSATRRHYVYRIVNRRARLALEHGRAWHVIEPLDEQAMQLGANHLVGHHDFTSFRDSACQAKSPEKTLEQLTVAREGEDIIITANARSFLHHQVRNMVGTLALVGKGRWQPADVKQALAAKDRASGGPTAPPDGLYLVKVDY